MRGAAVELQWRIAPQRRGRQGKVASPVTIPWNPRPGAGDSCKNPSVTEHRAGPADRWVKVERIGTAVAGRTWRSVV